MPGSAYPSYLARWRGFAARSRARRPGRRCPGPTPGPTPRMTYTPDPDTGVSWTERFARDEGSSGRIADITQHHYVGGGPGKTTAQQAISNMLSPEWVTRHRDRELSRRHHLHPLSLVLRQ